MWMSRALLRKTMQSRNVAWLSVTTCLSFWMKERKKIRNTTDGGLHLLTRSGLQKNTQKITKVSHVDLVRFLLRKADRWYWNRRTMPRCRGGSGLWGMGGGGSGVVVMTGENQACDVIISKIKKKWQNPSKVLVFSNVSSSFTPE